jgi:hypothetical protein
VTTETWDLWFPQAGATGVSFARSRIEAGAAPEGLLVHAAPPVLDVFVRDADEALLARGTDLRRSAPGPISRLVRNGRTITLEDFWPGAEDVGRIVILPGGEAGTLQAWWHADDRSEWRWQLELSNHT